MTTSMSLLSLLDTQTRLNQATYEETEISNKYNAIHKDLEKWVKIETKYDDAFDKVKYGDKDIERNGRTYRVGNDSDARAYAEAMTRYKEAVIRETRDELQLLDEEFDSQMTALKAEIEVLKTQKEQYKNNTAQFAKDTGSLQK